MLGASPGVRVEYREAVVTSEEGIERSSINSM